MIAFAASSAPLPLTRAVTFVAFCLFLSGCASSPEIPFAKASRETLVSTVVTNGKVEPVQWVAVRASRPGLIEKVLAERGQRVNRAQVLVELDAQEARTELAAAEARIAQARAEMEVIGRGGRQAELTAIENDLVQVRRDLDAAHKDLAALNRLVEKDAATRQERDETARRVAGLEAQIQALQEKRAALVTETDRTVAEAKLKEAEASARLARLRIEQAILRAPMAGVAYDMEIRPGSYLNPGDLVAKIGQIDKVRVRVYVDEPELGRVSKAMPVKITWDALPERTWKGEVEQTPAEIVALGTRQVGEVICIIDNSGHELLPGTNVNAEIISQVAGNALTIPKEALRRMSGETGVFVLEADKAVWRKVTVGASSVTRAQVLEGLAEGDSVALPSARELQDGLEVRPAYP